MPESAAISNIITGTDVLNWFRRRLPGERCHRCGKTRLQVSREPRKRVGDFTYPLGCLFDPAFGRRLRRHDWGKPYKACPGSGQIVQQHVPMYWEYQGRVHVNSWQVKGICNACGAGRSISSTTLKMIRHKPVRPAVLKPVLREVKDAV